MFADAREEAGRGGLDVLVDDDVCVIMVLQSEQRRFAAEHGIAVEVPSSESRNHRGAKVVMVFDHQYRLAHWTRWKLALSARYFSAGTARGCFQCLLHRRASSDDRRS